MEQLTRPEDGIALPGAVEEITAEWLADALAVNNPGVGVTSVELGEVIWGTATKVYVRATYDEAGEAAGLPPGLVVKAGFGGHELAEAILMAYKREVEFYRGPAAGLGLGLPDCHFAGMDSASGQALVLLEDMLDRGTRFLTPADTTTPELAAGALDFQARYHAATWDQPSPEGIQSYPGDLRPLLLRVLSGEYWEKSLAKPRAASVPAALREEGTMAAAVTALWEFDEANAVCLAHGDSHIGNMYIDGDGAPGFLDWQMAGRGHWAHDVAYFVISALPVEERRANERQLIEGYLARLEVHGASPPGFDDAWDAYRRHAVHGLLWAANADGMYAEETNAAMVERYSAAVEDLDTLSLLLG